MLRDTKYLSVRTRGDLRMMGVIMKYCMSMAMYHDTFTQSASPGLVIKILDMK